jgi:hypothetical protein
MSISSKLRLATGLLSELPASFDFGRPFIATDDLSLWVGQGPNLPLIQIGVSGSVTPASDYVVYNQSAASDTWVITHNLGLSPAVIVQDSTNTQVMVETEFTDPDTVTLTFAGAESGMATLIG